MRYGLAFVDEVAVDYEGVRRDFAARTASKTYLALEAARQNRRIWKEYPDSPGH